MDKLSWIFAYTILFIWSLMMILNMIPSLHYEPPVGIYPALMLVLGAVFGIKIVKGGGS